MGARHMCCGILNNTLMARVGPDQYEACLQQEHAREMNFTGRAMKEMVYINSPGVEFESDLSVWINTCLNFINTLPPKK